MIEHMTMVELMFHEFMQLTYCNRFQKHAICANLMALFTTINSGGRILQC